jgi:hypothetical protein
MTDMLIRNMAVPKAHMVFGIIPEEKKDKKNWDVAEKKDRGNWFADLWVSDILSPLLP